MDHTIPAPAGASVKEGKQFLAEQDGDGRTFYERLGHRHVCLYISYLARFYLFLGNAACFGGLTGDQGVGTALNLASAARRDQNLPVI
jgi:hypothetical protein